jgi:excisionase family DNA binding protein
MTTTQTHDTLQLNAATALTYGEAAELTGLSKDTIKRDREDGRYPTPHKSRTGRRNWRIPIADLVTAGRRAGRAGAVQRDGDRTVFTTRLVGHPKLSQILGCILLGLAFSSPWTFTGLAVNQVLAHLVALLALGTALWLISKRLSSGTDR